MPYNDLEKILNEYNWDDGFAIPKKILSNPHCDLALALKIFYLADGFAYLDGIFFLFKIISFFSFYHFNQNR